MLAGGAATAAELVVTVHGVASDEGHVLVALCTPETFLGADCPHTGKAPAAEGEVEVTVFGIEPGTYALQSFHDANDNLALDRNLVGLPEEGMGFGKDAKMSFGPPSFDEAAIRVGEDGSRAAFRMRYFGAD